MALVGEGSVDLLAVGATSESYASGAEAPTTSEIVTDAEAAVLNALSNALPVVRARQAKGAFGSSV